MNRRSTDVAKGIAIVMMLWHHAFYSSKSIAARVGGQAALSYAPFSSTMVFTLAKAFKLCVPIFVFITGYGTYRSLRAWKDAHKEQNVGTYAVAHHLGLLLQFLPVFVIGVTACILAGVSSLSAVYGENGKVAGAVYLLIDAMGLAKAFGTPTFVGTWWYLSLAILLMYLTPALVAFSDRLDSALLVVIVCLVPALAGIKMSTDLTRYLPAVALGIFCSQHRVFERSDDKSKPSVTTALIKLVTLVLALALVLYLERRAGFVWLFHSIGAAITCAIAMQLERMGDTVLAFLGKHSANMFMCHTFFLSLLTPRQIYGLGHWALVLLAIIAVSLLTSVVFEFLKDRLGYTAWSKKAANQLVSLIFGA